MVSAQSTTPDPRIEAIRMWRSLFSGFTSVKLLLFRARRKLAGLLRGLRRGAKGAGRAAD